MKTAITMVMPIGLRQEAKPVAEKSRGDQAGAVDEHCRSDHAGQSILSGATLRRSVISSAAIYGDASVDRLIGGGVRPIVITHRIAPFAL